MQTYRVRINPAMPHLRFAIGGRLYLKEKGWYEATESVARMLSKQPCNVLRPETSGFVFQVLTPEEATRLEQLEIAVVDPRGTSAVPHADPVMRATEPEVDARRLAAELDKRRKAIVDNQAFVDEEPIEPMLEASVAAPLAAAPAPEPVSAQTQEWRPPVARKSEPRKIEPKTGAPKPKRVGRRKVG